MRHLRFTWEGYESNFMSLITNGLAFQFDTSDIARIREEMSTLIDNLSKVYLSLLKDSESESEVAAVKQEKSSASNSSSEGEDYDNSKSDDDAPAKKEPTSNKTKIKFMVAKKGDSSLGSDSSDSEVTKKEESSSNDSDELDVPVGVHISKTEAMSKSNAEGGDGTENKICSCGLTDDRRSSGTAIIDFKDPAGAAGTLEHNGADSDEGGYVVFVDGGGGGKRQKRDHFFQDTSSMSELFVDNDDQMITRMPSNKSTTSGGGLLIHQQKTQSPPPEYPTTLAQVKTPETTDEISLQSDNLLTSQKQESRASSPNMNSLDNDGASHVVFVEKWVRYNISEENIKEQIQNLQTLFGPNKFNVKPESVGITIFDFAKCRGMYICLYDLC